MIRGNFFILYLPVEPERWQPDTLIMEIECLAIHSLEVSTIGLMTHYFSFSDQGAHPHAWRLITTLILKEHVPFGEGHCADPVMAVGWCSCFWEQSESHSHLDNEMLWKFRSALCRGSSLWWASTQRGYKLFSITLAHSPGLNYPIPPLI